MKRQRYLTNKFKEFKYSALQYTVEHLFQKVKGDRK